MNLAIPNILADLPSTPRLIAGAGYAAAFALYLLLRKRWQTGGHLTVRQGACLLASMASGSLAAAAIMAWAQSHATWWTATALTLAAMPSQVSLASLLGGWFGVEVGKRLLKITHPSGDVFVFPMMLGLSIARASRWLDASLPHAAIPYELAFLGLLAGTFAWRMRTHRQRGCMFSQFAFAYLGFGFLLEFFRPRYTLAFLPLSALQLTSLAGMIHALFHWNDECCGTAPTPDARACCPIPPIESGHAPSSSACCGGDGCCSGNGSSLCVELTNSLCPTCLRKVEAKILVEGTNVLLQKFCPEHGLQRVLISNDAAFWRNARALYSKPPTSPLRRNTPMQRGCPFDCGLCPDHDQHSCLAIVEITEQCDLHCNICYASSHAAGRHRTLPEIERMLDAVVANEGQPGVVQISGGEPTLHPDLFAILDAAKARPIRHLMLNTNGQRLAADREMVRRLATYMPAFELYLQFDSLRPASLQQLRGTDLSDIRKRALEHLNEFNLSTTLVVTLQKGVNDQEIGELLDFAASQPCVRGVTFQPVQAAGRLTTFNPATDRLTLSEVRSEILRQSSLFGPEDLVAVPCHPDALVMGYALRSGMKLTPLSRWVDPQTLLNLGGNTICYEQDPNLRNHVRVALAQPRSKPATPASVARDLKLECCLPLLPGAGSPVAYDKVFRIIIMQFMDAYSMDLRSLKRACVHIVQPDGRLIPFDTCNLLYRNQATTQPTPRSAVPGLPPSSPVAPAPTP